MFKKVKEELEEGGIGVILYRGGGGGVELTRR